MSQTQALIGSLGCLPPPLTPLLVLLDRARDSQSSRMLGLQAQAPIHEAGYCSSPETSWVHRSPARAHLGMGLDARRGGNVTSTATPALKVNFHLPAAQE